MKPFSNSVCEKIAYYVYILRDPLRDDEIFYVGKGVNNRLFNHVEDALSCANTSDKLDRIREIHKSGLEVGHFILRHGLSEYEALEIESACIDLLGIEKLTNAVKGHNTWDRGLKSVDEVVQYYDAKSVFITEPAVIININKLFIRNMSPKDLYEATRKSWVIGIKRDRVNYAIAAYRGLIREVYKIAKWEPSSIKGRWAFVGEIAPDEIRDKYINHSLENYITKGSQNPIKYTF